MNANDKQQQQAQPIPSNDGSWTIIIRFFITDSSSLNAQISRDEIMDHFSTFGTIQNITIHSPSSTSPSITSQCVFVQYEERQSAQLAIDQMNNQPLWNQQKSHMSDGGGDSRRIKLEVNWVFMDGPLENHYTRYCSSSRHRRDRNREQSRRHVYLDHQQNRERSASSSYNRTQDDSHRRSHHQKRHRKNSEDDVTTTANDKKKQKIHQKHDMQTETIADTATTTIERTKDDHIDSNVANDSKDNNHCLKQQPTDSDNIERSNEE